MCVCVCVCVYVKGDNFSAIDSLQYSGSDIQFNLSNENHSGLYRLVLGQTPYARLMKQAPQQLNFIFNKENIHIKTDFKAPLDSALVLQSEENKLWYEVLRAKSTFHNRFSILEKEVDHYWSSNDTTTAWEKSNEFNRLQMAHDIYLGQHAQQYSNLLVSKYISAYRQPVTDGYLTLQERKQVFQNDFFKTLDFSHKELIYSTIYTDKVFEYLVTFNQPTYTQAERVKAYIPAVDEIMKQINKDPEVYKFLKDYLIHGFEVLKMQEVVNYIKSKYN